MSASSLLLLLVVVCGVLLQVHRGNGSPKTMSAHKINFGWPNFFNPELGMRRDKGKEHKEDNTVDTENGVANEDDMYEKLIDYTLKGGLRGTLIFLNSTAIPQGTNLTTSEMNDLTQAAKMVMETEGGEEEEEEKKEGEGGTKKRKSGMGILTEEGLHLRTPLLTKEHPEELGKYGAMISFYAGQNLTKFIYYGNWCGRGGRSAPVDPLDRCCLEHDKCYGLAVRKCLDVWKRPYNLMYAWTVMDGEVACVRSESSCVNHICNCDREAAECFQTHLFNGTSPDTKHLGTKTL